MVGNPHVVLLKLNVDVPFALDVKQTVSGILTVLGDEVQHRQPPDEDAHEPHVVQEDGESSDILGGPVVDLSLEDRVPLLDLHWLEDAGEHIGPLIGREPTEPGVCQQNLLEHEVNIIGEVGEALVHQP